MGWSTQERDVSEIWGGGSHPEKVNSKELLAPILINKENTWVFCLFSALQSSKIVQILSGIR
jgi:hypothetical protein